MRVGIAKDELHRIIRQEADGEPVSLLSRRAIGHEARESVDPVDYSGLRVPPGDLDLEIRAGRQLTVERKDRRVAPRSIGISQSSFDEALYQGARLENPVVAQPG